MRTLLIDGDILIYTAAAAAQETFDFGDGPIVHAKMDLAGALARVAGDLKHLVDTLEADRAIMCLSANGWIFRKDIAASYKSNRKAAKPVLYSALRAEVVRTMETFERPKLEGDDVMGILATGTKRIPGTKIIVSIDKDMEQIPGLLFNPNKDTAPRIVTPEAGARYHLYQTLIGDTTDGYPGCPGIGPVKANAILDKEASWAAVVATFEAKGLTGEDALVQARLAKILQHKDYNFRTREPILWTPEIPKKTLDSNSSGPTSKEITQAG